MEVVGLALAIVSAIDLCIKYGEKLVDACRTYKNAEAVLQEKALRVEACWMQIRVQIKCVEKHHQELGDELVDLQTRLFAKLEFKLRELSRTFDGLHGKQLQVKNWRVVSAKESLDKAIRELEEWRTVFDPTWVFVLKIAERSIRYGHDESDASLEISAKDAKFANGIRRIHDNTPQAVFFPDDRLAAADKSVIASSSAVLARDPKDGRSYIIEVLACEEGVSSDTLAKDVRSIVPRLQLVDPDRFGILQCKFAVRKKHDGQTTAFELVFRMVEQPGLGVAPTSLRVLLGSPTKHSLTERLFIAQQLARAVCFVHMLDFVHKNLRPESVLMFRRAGSALGAPYLVGFNGFRSADGRTRLHQHSRWDLNLYRHPERQGEQPHEAFTMRHDIYSLGVCLLEIGLWKTFVIHDNEGSAAAPAPSDQLGRLLESSQSPEAMKNALVSLSKEELPGEMGTRFAGVVTDCLTCLDADNEHFADLAEFRDTDGILVGVKFIEKILLELEAIVL